MKPDTPDMIVYGQQLDSRWQDRAVERATIKQRYAEQMKADLAKADYEVSKAMHRALAAGYSKSRIGRMIGTADWRTINNFLAIAAHEFEVETVAAQAADFVRFTHEIDHNKGLMKVTLHVRGDGLEVRRTPRIVKFTYRNAATFADFNTYSAVLGEFDLTDLDLVRQIRNDLQENVPVGRAIKVLIRGLEDGPAVAPPVQEEDPLQYMTAADWDALRDDE